MKRLTGLFLGAGASYEVGMPLMWELTAEIKNWLTRDKLRQLNVGWRIQGNGFPDEVVNDLASILELSGVHYEGILGYLETQFRRQRKLAQQYHGLYSWLVDLVYHLLYFRQVNNNTFLKQQLPRYDGILALAETNTPLWVFSLNHDVMIEAVAARLSIPIHSGFGPSIVTLPRRDPSGRKKGDIRAEVLTKRDLEQGAMYFPNPFQPGIYLQKIHGALDIFTFNNGEDLLKFLPSAPGQDGVIEVLRAANEELFYLLPYIQGRGKVKTINEIAYADDEGEMQFLRRSLLAGANKFDARKSQVLPKSVLKHFRQNINFVTILVCIGYSFGDSHINAVLQEWLEFSAERKLEIVDPNVSEVPQFLLHVAPQVELIKCDATEYLDSKGGIKRSAREKMEKRLISILRSFGRERASQVIASFIRDDKERVARALADRLQKLPIANGQPDFTGIDAKQWAAEMKLNRDDVIDRLLETFESKTRNQTDNSR